MLFNKQLVDTFEITKSDSGFEVWRVSNQTDLDPSKEHYNTYRSLPSAVGSIVIDNKRGKFNYEIKCAENVNKEFVRELENSIISFLGEIKNIENKYASNE